MSGERLINSENQENINKDYISKSKVDINVLLNKVRTEKKKERVLDQRLIRENPTLVEEMLSTRGKFLDISHLHKMTIQRKEIDIELCKNPMSFHSTKKKLAYFTSNTLTTTSSIYLI